jgi:hypothetical protein
MAKKLKKYRVYGTVVGSAYLGEFEATSKKQAEALALESTGNVILCHQCSDKIEDPEVTEAFAELVKGKSPNPNHGGK